MLCHSIVYCTLLKIGLICLLAHVVRLDESMCSNLPAAYNQNGLEIAIPEKQFKGPASRLCSSYLSCCTDEVLNQLSNITIQNYSNKVELLTISMKTNFNKKHKKFNEFFEQLITNAGITLNTMFLDTYGVLYSANADVFVKLFQDLKAYYHGSNMDVTEIFDGFFTEVMLRVFELLHSDYTFTDEYRQCIADNMESIKPFAATPVTLAGQFRRSFIVARTFVRGLNGGRLFSGGVAKFRPSQFCVNELVAMSHCAACQNGTVVKPCVSLCLGVMRGCLVDYRRFSQVWDAYIGELRHLLDRLDGPFNIEAVLEPFEVKLSEAVMMLQENKHEINQTVFRICGKPKKRNSSTTNHLGGFTVGDATILNISFSHPSRNRRSTEGESHRMNEQRKRKGRQSLKNREGRGGFSRKHRISQSSIEETRYRYNKEEDSFARERHSSAKTALGTNLASLVAQMRRTLKTYEHHWKKLSQKVCDDVAEASATCWNGKTVTESALNDEIEQEFEKRITSNHVTKSHVHHHQRALSKVVTELKQGNNGMDPQSPPSDDEEDNYYSGDGSAETDPVVDPDFVPKSNVEIVDTVHDETTARAADAKKICSGSDCGGVALVSPSVVLVGFSVLLSLVT